MKIKETYNFKGLYLDEMRWTKDEYQWSKTDEKRKAELTTTQHPRAWERTKKKKTPMMKYIAKEKE